MSLKKITVGNRIVGAEESCYIIAEIGSNHNQDKAIAFEMMDMAAQAGADAVKFQSIQFNQLYKVGYETHSFREWFKQIELNEDWHHDLAVYAKKLGIHFLSSPTYLEAINLLEKCDVPAYKIASPQVQGNIDIVRLAARTGKPLFLSVGYCDYGDIAKAIDVCKQEKNENTIFLHCISDYPLRMRDANIKFIETLKLMTGGVVGYSDHSLGYHLSIAAVAMGASVIEKHVTTDRKNSGPDHHFALQMNEFAEMVCQIRDLEVAMGSGVKYNLTEREVELRERVSLKAFSNASLPVGSKISEDFISWARFSGSNGISRDEFKILSRFKLQKPLSLGELVTWDKFGVGDDK